MVASVPTIGVDVATLTFEVELIYEGTGHFLNFDVDWEEWDVTEEEARDIASEIESGMHQAFYDEVMNNISIVPRLVSIEGANQDD